jgi:hypothetical protein
LIKRVKKVVIVFYFGPSSQPSRDGRFRNEAGADEHGRYCSAASSVLKAPVERLALAQARDSQAQLPSPAGELSKVG